MDHRNPTDAQNQGEGNREADRRYREGVQETVRNTTEEEREDQARELTGEEQEQARAAEQAAKKRRKPSAGKREI